MELEIILLSIKKKKTDSGKHCMFPLIDGTLKKKSRRERNRQKEGNAREGRGRIKERGNGYDQNICMYKNTTVKPNSLQNSYALNTKYIRLFP